MALLQLAQAGCGGMGLRHVYGLAELRRCGFDTFELAALCDLHSSAAEHVARVAETELGLRPRVYTDFRAMLDAEPGLDAVNIVTDTRMHHVFAVDAFDAGLNVAVEKPMGLTVRACRRMIGAANAAGKVLSVSENYRRDPMNRLTKALLHGGVIGEPRLAISVATSGGRGVRQVVAWRHMKERGGLILEYGVHTSDLTLYLMGGVERVFAETHLWEKTRTMVETAQPMQRFYEHRVKEDAEKAEAIEATAEDTGLALVRFASGAIGQTTYSDAAPGEPSDTDIIYGSEGSLRLPGSRSGRPVQVTMSGGRSPVGQKDLLAQAPDFRLDETTSRMFGGRDRISSYDAPFEQPDRKLIAIELQDFADAILNGRRPEVTGKEGLDAVALSYAILESGHLVQPVSFDDVRSDRVNAYQQQINQAAKL